MRNAVGREDKSRRWEIIHLPGEAAAPDAQAPRLEIRWRDGVPVSGTVYPAGGGRGRAHPVPPDQAEIAPRGRGEAVEPAGLTLSVVIPTCDREEDLARCLASFAAQTRPPDQVIVVDNASRKEGTRKAAEAAGVTCILEPRRGLDFARNAGVLQAEGDVIAFCDDDVVLHADWGRQMLMAFARCRGRGRDRAGSAARARDAGAADFRVRLGIRAGLRAHRLRFGFLRANQGKGLPGMDRRCRGEHGVPAGGICARRAVRRTPGCRGSRVQRRFRDVVSDSCNRRGLPLRAADRLLPSSPANHGGFAAADPSLHAGACGRAPHPVPAVPAVGQSAPGVPDHAAGLSPPRIAAASAGTEGR